MKKALCLSVFMLLALTPLQAYMPDLKSFEKVVGVPDAETLLLDNGTTVRLIGIDASERKHPDRYFEAAAREFVTKNLLGERVRLEYDWVKRDPSGRPMVYAYRIPDEWFLNGEMIREGVAFIDESYPPSGKHPKHPFKLHEKFKRYEGEAQTSRKGLWVTLSKSSRTRKF